MKKKRWEIELCDICDKLLIEEEKIKALEEQEALEHQKSQGTTSQLLTITVLVPETTRMKMGKSLSSAKLDLDGAVVSPTRKEPPSKETQNDLVTLIRAYTVSMSLTRFPPLHPNLQPHLDVQKEKEFQKMQTPPIKRFHRSEEAVIKFMDRCLPVQISDSSNPKISSSIQKSHFGKHFQETSRI